MERRFTHLRLKLLLWIFLGAVGAWSFLYLFVHFVFNGLMHNPLEQLCVWLAENWQGATAEEAQAMYEGFVSTYKPAVVTGAMGVIMLVACYIGMGRFGGYLNQITRAVRQVFNETGEQIKLPRELEPVQADLVGIQRALASRREVTQAGVQRRSDLIAYLAHDLKTPLTSTLGYLELLNDQPNLTVEQRAKYTGIALEKARRLEKLIGEFFDISRMELHQGDAPRTQVRLDLLLCQLVDEFYPLFAEKRLSCVQDIDCKLNVVGMPDRLARAFDNILRNAVSYSTVDTAIHLSLKYTPGWAEISISNQGLEIPERELAAIFTKFYRLDEARQTRTGGAGLGLAIAKEIVELHGGAINASSNGSRTTFTVRLPAEEL